MMRSARETLFFSLQRCLGSRAGAAYRFLKQQETWSVDRLKDWQQKQFHSLAREAVKHSAFYRDRVSDSANFDLTDFPIITKASLASRFTDIMSDNLRDEYSRGEAKGYSWLKVTSGGTTGMPTTVIHDADFRDKDRAARIYEMYLGGFPFGTAHFRLWGSMHDIQRTRASIQQRVISALANETLLNAFQMDDDKIEGYIRLLNESRIDHIIAYVDAIYQLAKYANRTGVRMRPLASIMTTGGTLTDSVRDELHRTFGARIHNKYGSRDAGDIACDCESGHLHVLPHIIVEIVDEQGKPLPPGETGRVLVTFLGNVSFPLIRFDITDMAASSSATCACGRPFPILDRLEGRATDFLFSSNGGFVSPVYIRHVVGVVHGKDKLRRFQLVQETATDYTLKLQPEPGVTIDEMENVRAPLTTDLQAVLGAGARINIQISETIPETGGGKFQYIINRHRQQS